MAKGNEVIVKTYTCEFCSVIYHAFHRSEQEAYDKLNKKDQDKFDKERLDAHIKVCFNKSMYTKKVENAAGK